MAKNTDFGFAPDEVPDDELERLYAQYNDAELDELYDKAVEWRDWMECEFLNMEVKRRRNKK